jgi:hypothetical protein
MSLENRNVLLELASLARKGDERRRSEKEE